MKQIWHEQALIGDVERRRADWQGRILSSLDDVYVLAVAWWDKATGTTRIDLSCSVEAIALARHFEVHPTREDATRAIIACMGAYIAGIDVDSLDDTRTDDEVRASRSEEDY